MDSAMAALYWHFQRRALDPGQPLQSFREFIGNQLRQEGFQSVNVDGGGVSGVMGDSFIVVGHLELGGGQYYEVTMTGGEDGNTVSSANQQAVHVLAGIASL
jgi:hypothetical protein